jgi:hypothetical protein
VCACMYVGMCVCGGACAFVRALVHMCMRLCVCAYWCVRATEHVCVFERACVCVRVRCHLVFFVKQALLFSVNTITYIL